jgi:hypothetical protein
MVRLAALVLNPGVNPGSRPGQALSRFARIIPDTRPLRGPASVVQIRSRRICHGVVAGAPDRPTLVVTSADSSTNAVGRHPPVEYFPLARLLCVD